MTEHIEPVLVGMLVAITAIVFYRLGSRWGGAEKPGGSHGIEMPPGDSTDSIKQSLKKENDLLRQTLHSTTAAWSEQSELLADLAADNQRLRGLPNRRR